MVLVAARFLSSAAFVPRATGASRRRDADGVAAPVGAMCGDIARRTVFERLVSRACASGSQGVKRYAAFRGYSAPKWHKGAGRSAGSDVCGESGLVQVRYGVEEAMVSVVSENARMSGF